LVACSSAAGQGSAASAEAGLATAGPSAGVPAEASAAPESATAEAPGDESADLPDNWPAGLPPYEGGRLVSVIISDDGLNVNAVWGSDATAQDAWAAMDTALRDEGFAPTRETGGEDMLVEDETMKSDYYLRDTFEVNLVVLPGEQTTVLVNASQL
jgi:hypothetical protein